MDDIASRLVGACSFGCFISRVIPQHMQETTRSLFKGLPTTTLQGDKRARMATNGRTQQLLTTLVHSGYSMCYMDNRHVQYWNSFPFPSSLTILRLIVIRHHVRIPSGQDFNWVF